MTITREEIEERRDALVADRDALLERLQHYRAAIGECNHWLELLEEESSIEAVPDPDSEPIEDVS